MEETKLYDHDRPHQHLPADHPANSEWAEQELEYERRDLDRDNFI